VKDIIKGYLLDISFNNKLPRRTQNSVNNTVHIEFIKKRMITSS
jgi:hypothetical protein